MARQRLINCDFLNDSAFKEDTTNKAKLLYLMMIINADDKGFVGNTRNIINSLQNNDTKFRNEINLQLLQNDYESALEELIEKGFLYEFINKHHNKVHLIRHWWYHNKMKKELWTNYYKYSKLVEVEDNEYVLKKSKTKENNKINQDKLNQNNINQDKIRYSNDNNETEHNEEDIDIVEMFKERDKNGGTN